MHVVWLFSVTFIQAGAHQTPLILMFICFHCIDSVEDELHFLIGCPFYDDMRRKMFHKAQLRKRDFILYDSTAKMIFLLNHVNMQPILASTLFDMFQRRKRTI